MKENKISFIICCNNDFYLEECRLYLNDLIVPDGMEMDIIEVRGASSMTSGCNTGMKRSNAKYKVYLHQDVFIKNKNFISDILSVFQDDEKIGMIGMVGTPYMAKTGTMWEGIRFGAYYKLEEYIERGVIETFRPLKSGYLEVEAVDGLLIATQYDLPWRDDIFQKWDFYDVSQSYEFIKAGYKVVVPGQNPEWYIHDCGIINLMNYSDERKKFLKYYSEFIKNRQGENWEQYRQKVVEKVNHGYHGTEAEKEELINIAKNIKDY